MHTPLLSMVQDDPTVKEFWGLRKAALELQHSQQIDDT